MPKPPNIVLFVPDSYRGDVLGHLGNPGAVTPNLDAVFARGAVSYANAFAQNPVCTPSRCSFMTGWYLHTHGHRSMRNMLKEHEPNLLTVLRNTGYDVWWAGKNDLVRVREPADYRRWCDVKVDPAAHAVPGPPHRAPDPWAEDDVRRGAFYRGVWQPDPDGDPLDLRDEGYTRGAADLIRHHDGDRPFCCYVPLGLPHPAYATDAATYNRIDPERLPPRIADETVNLPSVIAELRRAYRSDRIPEALWREVKHVYYAMCAKVDDLFGQVVAALDDAGVYDNTWIFFFSDHGDFAGDYGLPEKTHVSLQDSLLRVPLLVKPPAGVPVAPGIRRQLVELVDVPTTLYDLLGIDPGYPVQGRSLRASLAGDDTPSRDAVFAEVGARRGEEAFVNPDALQAAPGSFYPMQASAAIPAHRRGSHAVMCRTTTHKYVRRVYTGEHELYDLTADPGETVNLAGDPAYAATEQALAMRLLDHLLDTADVLPLERDTRRI